MKKNNVCYLLVVLFLLLSCKNNVYFSNNVKIANWNVQTFFDANDDGIEYEEFRSKKSLWNEDKYNERLDKLCQIIEKIDADVFVMEEIENEKILYDISNRLSHNSWFGKKVYKYSTFCKEEGGSIGCAVLSRMEIQNVKFHSLDIKTESEKVPSMRPIMELKIITSKNNEKKNITLFVNHWKSKSGGALESEKWRQWQEKSLSNIFNAENNSDVLVATGDFNKDINEFSRNENNQIVLNDFDSDKKNQVIVYSPWDDCENQIGTYYFDNQWSRIDHFFVAEKKVITEFNICDFPELLTSSNIPNRYKIYSNEGFSDHLPIMCVIDVGVY